MADPVSHDDMPLPVIRVLLVDDDEDDYFITKELLKECEGTQFHLDWINNYADAQAAIAGSDYDVFLIDYYLGSGNGLDLLAEMVQQGCRAPAILLTGLGDREVDMKAMRAGAADYLVKGRIDAPLLERSIRYSLERRRAQEERERLIAELQDALTKIKTLGGLLPICSSCKKIRDDSGYWNQVEVYIRDHTDADFTHGLCPDCYDALLREISETETHEQTQQGQLPATG
jgi:DNA-binding NtrC family response regulator